MNGVRVFFARLLEWLRPRRVDDDMNAELASHLDHLTDEYVRRGMTRDNARAAARRQFGGLDQTKEAVRDRRGFSHLDALGRDLRYAARLLAKSRAFTVTAVLTLALGIGVNTAIFSFVNAVLLRPLPYADADRLVSLWEGQVGGRPDVESSHGASIAHDVAAARMVVAPANLVDYRRAQLFQALAGVTTVGHNLTGAGTPERLLGEEVTWNYFAVLGATPALGRVFDPAEDQPGAPPVVILSTGLWQARFGSDDRIVGRTVTLDNTPYQVVGLMPAGFTPVTQYTNTEPITFWTPAGYPPDLLGNHGDHEINVVGRLAPRASLAAAQAELTTISEGLAKQFPKSNSTIRAFVTPLRDDIVAGVRTSFIILVATVSAILLIACVNVANLLLVRAVARRREMAVRVALGAARSRVMTELVTESLLLSGVACAVGLFLAEVTRRLLVAAAPATIPRLADVSLDWHVLGFAVIVSLATGLGFGLLPAWQGGRARPVDALRSSERVVAGTWVMKWRNALMVVEVALSVTLVAVSALLIQSLMAVQRVPLGFEASQVFTLQFRLPQNKYAKPEDIARFFKSTIENVRAVPGVQSAALVRAVPFSGNGGSIAYNVEGQPQPDPVSAPQALFHLVTPDYFKTMRIPILKGRDFTDRDDRRRRWWPWSTTRSRAARSPIRIRLASTSRRRKRRDRSPSSAWSATPSTTPPPSRSGRSSTPLTTRCR